MSTSYQHKKLPNSNFFPSTLNDWSNFDDSIRNPETISIFKNRLLSFIRPVQSKYYNLFDLPGLIFLIYLHLGFGYFNEDRFCHNFQEYMNPLCSCSLEVEDTLHCLLHFHHFPQFRNDLINGVKYVYDNFESSSDKVKMFRWKQK